MTITEYFKNYSTTKQFPNLLPNGCDKTIDDFYNSCIVKNLCSTSNFLAWHKMFMDYIELPNAVFWIRYYESGSKANGKWSNRRASYSEFEDGFSYVFVSNYDVHEIFNMVFQGVTPNAEEFLDLMKSFKYPLHYDPGKRKKKVDDEEQRSSCEETAICAYPNIGSTRGGVLTEKHWYLAHINAIKEGYLRPDGMIKKLSKQETNKIFPQGIVSDWKQDPNDGIMKRKLGYSLSQDEKDLVKAHFLRFVDPLNYFIVPGEKFENNSVCKKIGEFDDLISFVSNKYESIYGKSTVMGFRDKALLGAPCNLNDPNLGQRIIDIKYGSILETNNCRQSASKSAKTKVKTNSNNKKTKNVTTMPKINSRSILATLRNMQQAGTLPKTVTLTNNTNFEDFLNTGTDVTDDAARTYLSSIGCDRINPLLNTHGLPQDIYMCQDLYKLVDVLDELVNNKTTDEARKALANGGEACRPALCYLIVYLLSNKGIVIWP